MNASGNVIIANGDWYSGTMSGAGVTEITDLLTIERPAVTTNHRLSAGRRIKNESTINLKTGVTVSNAGGDGAGIDNYGTFNLIGSSGFSLFTTNEYGDDDMSFENHGTLNKTLADTSAGISLPFNNHGSVHVQAGSLSLSGGGVSTGTFTVDAGATLEMSDQSIVGASITGEGTLRAGNLFFDDNSTFNFGGHTILGGTLDIEHAYFNSLTLAGSVGPILGTLHASGNVDWLSPNDVVGPGTIIIDGVFTLDGLPNTLNGGIRVKSNNATNLSGWGLVLSNTRGGGTTFENNGAFNVTDGADIYFGREIGSTSEDFYFENNGTFIKTGAGTITEIMVPFTNRGDFIIDSGRVDISGNFIQTDGRFVMNGTQLLLHRTLQLQGGSFEGTGEIIGNITTNGLVSPGHSAGKLQMTGYLTLQNDAELLIEVGGLMQGDEHDFIDVFGLVTLNGDLTVRAIAQYPYDIATGDILEVLKARFGFSGAFDNAANGSTVSHGGMVFRVHYGDQSLFDPNSLFLEVVAVPEPAALALLLLTPAILLRRAGRQCPAHGFQRHDIG